MAIVDMKHLTLIGMKGDQKAILKSLQKAGAVEIVKGDEQEQAALNYVANEAEMESLSAQREALEQTIKMIEREAAVKHGMLEQRLSVEYSEYEKLSSALQQALPIVEDCGRLDKEISDLRLRESRLQGQIAFLEPWKKLDLSLNASLDTRTAQSELGTLPADKFGGFSAEAGDSCHIEIVNQTEQAYYLFVAFLKKEQGKVAAAMNNWSFTKVELPSYEGTIHSALENWKQEVQEGREKLKELRGKIAGYAEKLPLLKKCCDAVSSDLQAAEMVQRLGCTQSAFVLEGWIPADRLSEVSAEISSIYENIYIASRDPVEGEDVPVLLKNNNFVQPFEDITEMYSTPLYGDIDPTPLMAPFYWITFGIMLGDVGYGLLLLLATLFMIKKADMQGGMRNLVKMLFYCSFPTIIGGVLFGGWFADAGSTLFGIDALAINPMEGNGPLQMLIFSVLLGAVQIIVGLLAKMVVDIKHGQVWDGIRFNLTWILLFAGFALFATPYKQVALIVTIVGAASVVLLQGNGKNPIKRIGGGLGKLYGITSFLSDVLSYARIFALVLATSVIGMVMNLLAGMMFGNPIMWIFGVLILVGGHIFNILISGLSAYVHTARLQFIEFFGKFYEGGGTKFQPLRIDTKYTKIIQRQKTKI